MINENTLMLNHKYELEFYNFNELYTSLRFLKMYLSFNYKHYIKDNEFEHIIIGDIGRTHMLLGKYMIVKDLYIDNNNIYQLIKLGYYQHQYRMMLRVYGGICYLTIYENHTYKYDGNVIFYGTQKLDLNLYVRKNPLTKIFECLITKEI